MVTTEHSHLNIKYPPITFPYFILGLGSAHRRSSVIPMIKFLFLTLALDRIRRESGVPHEECSANDLKQHPMDDRPEEPKTKVDLSEVVQNVKNKLTSVKDAVAGKLSQIWHELTGHDEDQWTMKEDQEVQMDATSLPKFSDPLMILGLHESYTLGDVNFSGIEVYGLSTLKDARLRINRKNKSVRISRI